MISVIRGTIAPVDDCGTLLKMLLIVDPPCTRVERLIWDFCERAHAKTHISKGSMRITRVVSLSSEEY